MGTSNPNVMYVDYKFWYNKETGVITLDEEMNLEIQNGTKFEFKNNQFTPIIKPKWTYNTYTDAYELGKDTESSLMGILYENKE